MSTPAYLDEFATRAAAVLGADIEVSITMRHNGVVVRGASSSARAARCDQVETRTNLGPCLDAMDQVIGQVVPDLSQETRWQPWRDAALAEGFRSALAVPALALPDSPVSLNVYSVRLDPWSPGLITATDSYVQLLAASVRLRLELSDLEDATGGVYRQYQDAEIVEQAAGALVQLNDVSLQSARRALEAQSIERQVPLREVAETLLKALGPADATWARAANLREGDQHRDGQR